MLNTLALQSLSFIFLALLHFFDKLISQKFLLCFVLALTNAAFPLMSAESLKQFVFSERMHWLGMNKYRLPKFNLQLIFSDFHQMLSLR